MQRDSGELSVENIAAQLSGVSTAQLAPALLALKRPYGNRFVQQVVAGIQANQQDLGKPKRQALARNVRQGAFLSLQTQGGYIQRDWTHLPRTPVSYDRYENTIEIWMPWDISTEPDLLEYVYRVLSHVSRPRRVWANEPWVEDFRVSLARYLAQIHHPIAGHGAMQRSSPSGGSHLILAIDVVTGEGGGIDGVTLDVDASFHAYGAVPYPGSQISGEGAEAGREERSETVVAVGAPTEQRSIQALSEPTVAIAQDNLISDPQEAINVIVEELSSRGRLDLSLIEDREIVYNSNLTGHTGFATPRGTFVEPATGVTRVNPVLVEIGDLAFVSVRVLYSAMMHEYQHVLQIHSQLQMATNRQQEDHLREVDAYLWEIEHSEESGIFNVPSEMLVVWRHLHFDHWTNLTAPNQQIFMSRYLAARRIVEEALGENRDLMERE